MLFTVCLLFKNRQGCRVPLVSRGDGCVLSLVIVCTALAGAKENLAMHNKDFSFQSAFFVIICCHLMLGS